MKRMTWIKLLSRQLLKETERMGGLFTVQFSYDMLPTLRGSARCCLRCRSTPRYM